MPTLLVITVLLPLLGSLVLFSSPRMDRRSARWLALGVALGTLALSAVLVIAFRPADPSRPETLGPQFAFRSGDHLGLPWLELAHGGGIRFAMGLDGLSLWLFALTALLLITAIFSSWESVTERAPTHYALLLALETGLL